MFKHSIKVPRLYKTAAKVAKEVKEGVGSIKQLVYEYRSKHPNIKAIYALVATLFQKREEVENLLKRSQLLVKEPRSDPWLTKILIVELLWGKKSIPGNSKPEKTVLAYEQIFKAHMSDGNLATEETEPNNKDEFKPRYVRVNTLKICFNEAVDAFRDEGWVLNNFLDKKDYDKYLENVTSLGEEEFSVDIHIPDLLIFPPKTQFYNHPAYKNGSIVLQDKASCLPVHILGPPPGSVVLDMCAAPGMKTTQVAALVKDQGKVYAVERDPRRFETLNKIVESSGATCVITVNKDVLTCSEKEFPGVQYILVDPSCSGSGIMGRMEFERSKSNERIERLAGFQIKILRSALTRYPDAKRVVYSTCSVFPEENEDVVRQVLETNATFKLVPAAKFVNDTWKNFGSPEYGNLGSYCLYAKPSEDFTNGFFVAVFERLEEGEENEFFNTKIYNFKKHVQNQEKRKLRQQQTNEQYANSAEDQSNCGFEENVDDQQNIEDSARKRKNKSDNVTNQEETIEIGSGEVKDNNSSDSVNKKKKKSDNTTSEEPTDDSSNKKQKKKKNNDITDQVATDTKEVEEAMQILDVSQKKKKKKKRDIETNDDGTLDIKEENSEDRTEDDDSGRKKKQKKQKCDTPLETEVADSVTDESRVSKKKKKRKYETDQSFEERNDAKTEEDSVELEHEEVSKEKKKKKKHKEKDLVVDDAVTNFEEDAIGEKKKNKKKK